VNSGVSKPLTDSAPRGLRDEREEEQQRGIGCGRIVVVPPLTLERKTAMDRILVWDIPTRVFHWLLTLTVIAALSIALMVDDDSIDFQLHMLLGLIAAFIVILRLLWGIVGSQYARFGSFLFGPRALFGYLRVALRGTSERYVGHNPGSAYAIYAMLLLTIGLVVTGLLMPSREALEELHEIMAYLMISVIVVHIIGLVWHTVRHRENIALSMIDGRKAGDPSQAIRFPQLLVGVAFLALSAGWAFALFSGYDAQARQLRLPVLDQTIRLGEHRSERASHGEREREEHDDWDHRKKRRGDRNHREAHEHDEDHEDDDD
jgi:cytochrome b